MIVSFGGFFLIHTNDAILQKNECSVPVHCESLTGIYTMYFD